MSINSRNGNTLLESGFFAPCRVATVDAIALSGLQTIDAVALAEGDRVLVKNQADATTNGIYAASSGAWVRTSDAAGNAQFFDGMAVIVAQGAVNAGLTFVCTTTDDPVIIGTSQLTFAAQAAVASATQTATSTSSLALTTGAKTLAIQAGKAFAAKQWVLIYETSNPDNCLLAEITSYSGTSLVTSVAAAGGSGGPYADWTVVLTNTPAAAGRQPPTGSGNVTGPGSAVSGNLAAFDGTTGKLIKDSGVAAGTLAGRNTLQAGDAGAGSILSAALALGAAPLPYCAAQPADNLQLSNDGTNPTRDVDVSAGRCRNIADTTNLQLAATMVKRLDQAWAAGGSAGAPAGACDSGTKGASQTWHAYLIGRLGLVPTSYSRTSNVATLTLAGHGLGAGGTVRVQGLGATFDGVFPISGVGASTVSYASTGADVGATAPPASASFDGFDVLASNNAANAYPSPAMPSGWTVKQCLGSVLTDGSANIIAFFQYADEFWYKTPIQDFNAANPSGNTTISVPGGVKVQAIFNIAVNVGSSSTASIYITSPDISGGSAGNSFATAGIIASGSTPPPGLQANGRAWTDTSSRVRVSNNVGGSATFTFNTLGYRDPRRRLF